jgi:hypothetical protein
MAASIKEILKLRQQLEERDSERNNSYDESVKFYAGSDLKTAKKQGFVGGIMQGLSSIFSAPADNEDAELRTPINVIKGAVENKVAFLALPPTVRVIEPPDSLAPGSAVPTGPTPSGAAPEDMGAPLLSPPQQAAPPDLSQMPPGMPPVPPSGPTEEPRGDWGIDLADRLECVVKSIMDFSNMPKRCRDVAWSMSVMDGAVIGVWPDFKHGKPRIFTRTPQDFYPVASDPDGLELSKAVWVEELSGHDISARWGNDKYVGRDDVKVTFYIDEEKFCTILDDKEWAHSPVDNTVGFVPIVCVGSLGMPGMIFGGNDVRDAIPIAKEINYHMSLLDDVAAATINPTVVITDPLNVSNFVALGKGGVIEVNAGGRVDTVGPQSLPNAFWQLGATLQNWLDVVMDNPAVLRGESGSSIVTGKGFNSQLGPIAARMQTRLEIVMSAWRQTLKYALMMWADFPGINGKLKASGVKNNETFYIEAEPADFMVDGKIWTELEVFLSAQSYIDRQGNEVMLMQLVQNELLSRDTAMDNLPQITNKKRENANIDRDRKWKAEGMAIANAAAQSPMTANVPLMSQEYTNYGLERGLMGEMPAMPGPEASMPPAPEGPPPEMPPEMPPPAEGMTIAAAEGEIDTAAEVLDAMREFFAGIPKLKGSVWFGGDPVLAPERIVSTEWNVTVWVTDPQDQGTITRAAEKVEEVYGHIKFVRGVPAPDEQAIQVAGEGGGPEEPQPTEEAPPDLSASPDLEAMMGGL